MSSVIHKDGTIIKLKQLYILDQGSTSSSSLSHYMTVKVGSQFRCKMSFPTNSFYSTLCLYDKNSTSRWHYFSEKSTLCHKNTQLIVGFENEWNPSHFIVSLPQLICIQIPQRVIKSTQISSFKDGQILGSGT